MILLLLSGCLDATTVVTTIDLRERRITVEQRDLHGVEDDLAEAKEMFEQGEGVDRKGLTLVSHTLIEREGALDGVLVYTFTDPLTAGLEPWDRDGRRVCGLEHVSASNADYVDARGCLVWKRGREMLRVVQASVAMTGGESLLPAWKAAQAP